MSTIVGFTTIIAVLATLFGGGTDFLVGGGVASWVAWVYAILIGISTFAITYEIEDGKYGEDTSWSVILVSLFFGFIGGFVSFYIVKAIVFSIFVGISNSISNVWLLALVGGVVSDIVLGIVFFVLSLILAAFGVGAFASRNRY